MNGDRPIDVLVVGAGPAGVAAGIGARRAGAGRVVVLERDWDLGGILQQCIHPGFGLQTFKEELTGPEYMHRFVVQAHEAGVEFLANTMVFGMDPDGSVWTMNRDRGLEHLIPGATVLAMGCRERPLGAIRIPGSRPAGIYTAGTAQRFVNMEGQMPGNRAVILGSGDIGLIMARRMIWEGATVEGVYEVMPWAGGLRRNIAQCLDDYGIPFHLETTVTRVHGRDRLEGVTVAKVDGARAPVPGTERFVPCDTLLLAVGLIPENELSRGAGVELHPVTGGPVVNDLLQTSRPPVFAAGNAVIVYDLVDNVSDEGLRAGANAARYARGELPAPDRSIPVRGGENVRLFSPQFVTGASDVTVYLRVSRPFECPCRVFAEPGLFSQKLRYARPGEMNEVRLGADCIRALTDLKEIVVDVEAL
ncbi:NAD(P)/FAD-dependent oxidoreductase [Fretibacterium sp. OH1220_COT-178]|uniref:NAD(P)/FAD-dependent oxidoreductase n=1 Tax=Fretibacterium sp. OH1220_COT-178 TaxID=2491047 RepID=UPI000F5F1000|nr:FAD-dependent oxidoreductase [Fretibacterium sp. OH1220_COT-178]RRD64187.1 pyridine nucleotide-disulfide oxidoreductase [Fretibacterium sp. OH1220_COT-178]